MRDPELENLLQDALDSGSAVWVVGDVHGYRETFEALLEELHLEEGDRVICLGDLIDRGPDSEGVMRIVRERDDVHSIRGNHDEMLRLSVSPKHGRMMGSWLRFGGEQTLTSFSEDRATAIEVARGWSHFVESLPTQIVLRDHRIVHAGYVSGKPLDDQNNQELMWSREIFRYDAPLDPARQIIVGHTTIQALLGPDSDGIWSSEVLLADGRPALLDIDTGIYLPGEQNPRITALNLRDGKTVSQSRLESA